MTLLILAGGLSSRYGSLKQIDGFGPNQEYLMEYTIYDAIQLGYSKIVFVIQEVNAEIFRSHFQFLKQYVEIEFVSQKLDDLPASNPIQNRVKPWGTGHAVWSARNHINENFTMINADDYYGRAALQMAFKHQKECALIGFPLHQTASLNGSVSRGICEVGKKGYLTSISEYTEIETSDLKIFTDKVTNEVFSPEALTSMNLFNFTPIIFEHLENGLLHFLQQTNLHLKSEYYALSAIDKGIKEGSLQFKVATTDSTYFGVTYAEDKKNTVQQLKSLIDTGIYPLHLWK